MDVRAADLAVQRLGAARLPSPVAERFAGRGTSRHYVDEDDVVLFDDTRSLLEARREAGEELPGFEPAGPRRTIFFDPSKTRVAIMTCGGLCPGLNDVIRGLVLELTLRYGVSRVVGFRNGYQGPIARYGHEVVELTPATVSGINEHGGTILGSSRGEQDPEEVVDCLERMGISILFVVGGDGTMRGAMRIAAVAAERGDRISVVGVPKTIDNDLPFIDQSFGFQTAVAQAASSIRAAHVEAKSAPGGIGLVRLMGRHSGFIACYAALANNDADFVLIPEVPFDLGGPGALLEALREKVQQQGHAVVVLAEGAGQELVRDRMAGAARDASGNLRLQDLGGLLRAGIGEHFLAHGQEVNLRWIDPSYAIRSVPANPYDAVYCLRLAHAAVHAAMAGRTAMVVGRWRSRFVHLPMSLVTRERHCVDPDGDLWLSVLEATGQPASMRDLPAVSDGPVPRSRRTSASPA